MRTQHSSSKGGVEVVPARIVRHYLPAAPTLTCASPRHYGYREIAPPQDNGLEKSTQYVNWPTPSATPFTASFGKIAHSEPHTASLLPYRPTFPH